MTTNPEGPKATMLLSRVARDIYWAGRYIERAEASARLVSAHTELFVDLPLSAGIGWTPLLAVTGTGEAFGRRHELITEDDVVGFLTVDTTHGSSVPAAVHAARENLRRTYDQFPRGAWEVLNDLHHWVTDNVAYAVPRRSRTSFLAEVIRRCQLFTGLLYDTMSQDSAYAFLEIGRFVERADMTTRVLDVQAEILLRQGQDESIPYADITWMAVLQSLNARQAFQRSRRIGVSGPEAIAFLLSDAQFPRSVEHCLTRVSRSLLELPNEERPMLACAELQARLEEVDAAGLEPQGLHELVDELQIGIARLHDEVVDTYFEVVVEASEETLALAR